MNPNSFHISKKSILLGLLIFVLFGGLGGTGYYFYSRYRQSQSEIEMLKNNPGEAAKIETRKIVAIIGKLIILPENETPIDITVTDIEKLKGQALFADAQNGDRMLVYSQAKKAVLYRPSVNKIVEVFNNITLNNPAPAGSAAPTSAPLPTPPETITPISPIP